MEESCSGTENGLRSLGRRSMAARVLCSGWLVLAAGMWLQSSMGAAYDFSIYSQNMKDNLGYSQQQLDSVSFAKDIGANVGVFSGLIYDASYPWVSLACAAVLGFAGNFMTWLSITRRVAVPSVWLMCLYSLLAANAMTFTNTAAVVTCVKIFPANRGTIVGLMKGENGNVIKHIMPTATDLGTTQCRMRWT